MSAGESCYTGKVRNKTRSSFRHLVRSTPDGLRRPAVIVKPAGALAASSAPLRRSALPKCEQISIWVASARRAAVAKGVATAFAASWRRIRNVCNKNQKHMD